MNMIRVTPDGRGFYEEGTGRRFVPVGTNYANCIGGYTAGDRAVGYSYLFGTDSHTQPDGLTEACDTLKRLADLGLNLVRCWFEPDEFFPHGTRLDPRAADRFDRWLETAGECGVRITVGVSPAPIPSGWKLHVFEPPHHERHLAQLRAVARRWGTDPRIFSWTVVGEGTLPWQTEWLRAQWPGWLRYWYNDDLAGLRKAWSDAPEFRGFEDAPVPPPNVGLTLPVNSVNPGGLKTLPDDRWANSTWRYDWRLFLEEIGSARVAHEVDTMRVAGARQMFSVGNNCWTVPNLPCGQMARGYNPYFYHDSVDYLCQHNYPAQYCWPGGNGDPLDSEEAMRFWLHANQAQGRLYTSMGKPVLLEEFGWYGGTSSKFGWPLPFRSEEEQTRHNDRIMETSLGTYAGWLNWPQKDMPQAGDITNGSGLFRADGRTLKHWGRRFGEWARRLAVQPPAHQPAREIRRLPMKALYTSDRDHEQWWQETCGTWNLAAPDDFEPEFERKPIVNSEAWHRFGGTTPFPAKAASGQGVSE